MHNNTKPMLDRLRSDFGVDGNEKEYPFSLNIIKNLAELDFPTNVTLFVGENGSGKSTLLEAIAIKAGFGIEGGSKNIQFKTGYETTYAGVHQLHEKLILSWRMKPKDGYFFRAESFFNVANYIDYLEYECGGRAYDAYGGKSLHAQSHGESFLSFFQHRLRRGGFFIFDEPEAALSPQRQLALMAIMHEMLQNTQSQFIIATHSPLLLAFPQATIYSCDGDKIEPIAYEDTEHYQVTKNFLNNPDQYFRYLFKD